MKTAIHFTGLLRSPVSWAKVGRELIAALAGAGAYVSAVSLKGFLYDGDFTLGEAVEAALAGKRREGWDVSLDYPPNFARLGGRRRAGILIYEADAFPQHWAAAAAQHLDLALVPSAFCLEAAVASGIPLEMLHVAPFGVNAEIYKPEGRKAAPHTGRSFNFLAVAAPHIRKGLAELTQAFSEAFAPADDVGLVIKCPPLAGLARRPWEYRSTADLLPEGRGRQVALLTGSYSEGEMAALYRAGDVYVQPSYGESFGLSPIEAAACGTPVIATGWGGALGYLDGTNSWLVDYDLVDARDFAYDWRGEWPAAMARPRVSALAETLRRAYGNTAERQSKSAAALETARRFTWLGCADAVLASLT